MDMTEPRRGAPEDHIDSNDYSDHSPASFHEAKQELPDDLPKSLDDRRSVPVFQPETEMYDAWQGECPCVRGTISPSPRRWRSNYFTLDSYMLGISPAVLSAQVLSSNR
jgi:hypothetical protein